MNYVEVAFINKGKIGERRYTYNNNLKDLKIGDVVETRTGIGYVMGFKACSNIETIDLVAKVDNLENYNRVQEAEERINKAMNVLTALSRWDRAKKEIECLLDEGRFNDVKELKALQSELDDAYQIVLSDKISKFNN